MAGFYRPDLRVEQRMRQHLSLASAGIAVIPAVFDPLWASVWSLLHGDGADAATAFPDAVAGRSWTTNGNTQVDTAQSVFGGAGILFDGNGDYLISNATLGFAASEAFCIEFRVRLSTLSGWQIIGGTGSGLLLNFNHSGAPGKFQAAVGGSQVNGTTTVAANTWYTVCVERDASGVVRLIVNGVVESTSSITNAITAASMYWGCIPPYGGATLALNGWLDEMRITKGASRYGGAYTPAVAVFPNG